MAKVRRQWIEEELFGATGLQGETGVQGIPGIFAAHSESFIDSDLTAGKIVINHGLDTRSIITQVVDPDGLLVFPSEIKIISLDEVELDFSGLAPIDAGNWVVNVVATNGMNPGGGVTGPSGAQGATGVPGETGAQGLIGLRGDQGDTGLPGPGGVGVPPGGTGGSIYVKASDADFDGEWVSPNALMISHADLQSKNGETGFQHLTLDQVSRIPPPQVAFAYDYASFKAALANPDVLNIWNTTTINTGTGVEDTWTVNGSWKHIVDGDIDIGRDIKIVSGDVGTSKLLQFYGKANIGFNAPGNHVVINGDTARVYFNVARLYGANSVQLVSGSGQFFYFNYEKFENGTTTFGETGLGTIAVDQNFFLDTSGGNVYASSTDGTAMYLDSKIVDGNGNPFPVITATGTSQAIQIDLSVASPWELVSQGGATGIRPAVDPDFVKLGLTGVGNFGKMTAEPPEVTGSPLAVSTGGTIDRSGSYTQSGITWVNGTHKVSLDSTGKWYCISDTLNPVHTAADYVNYENPGSPLGSYWQVMPAINAGPDKVTVTQVTGGGGYAFRGVGLSSFDGIYANMVSYVRGRLRPQAAAPVDPTEGEFYTNEGTEDLYVYLGGQWKSCTVGNLSNPMTVKGDLIAALDTATPATPTRVGAGPVGHVLMSNGPGELPGYQPIVSGSTGIVAPIYATLTSFPSTLANHTYTSTTQLWVSMFSDRAFTPAGIWLLFSNESSGIVHVVVMEQLTDNSIICRGKGSSATLVAFKGFLHIDLSWGSGFSFNTNTVYWVGIQDASGALSISGYIGALNAGEPQGGQVNPGGPLTGYTVDSTAITANSRPNTGDRLWARIVGM